MKFYFQGILCVVSNLDFCPRRHQEILLIQSGGFHHYLYLVLVRIVECHLFI